MVAVAQIGCDFLARDIDRWIWPRGRGADGRVDVKLVEAKSFLSRSIWGVFAASFPKQEKSPHPISRINTRIMFGRSSVGRVGKTDKKKEAKNFFMKGRLSFGGSSFKCQKAVYFVFIMICNKSLVFYQPHAHMKKTLLPILTPRGLFPWIASLQVQRITNTNCMK